MTAFVAVCLTLTSPYVFKISRSFLIWICITLATAAKAWSSAHGFESVERQHLLASDDEVVAQPSATEQPADASNKSSSRKHADPPPAQSIPTSESLDTTSNDSGRSAGTSPPTAATVQITQSRPKPALEPSTRGSQNPAIDDLLESSDSRDTVWHYVKPLLQRGAREFRAPSKTMIVIATVLFGLFIAQAVAGVFSTKIVSDRAGLSSSQRCGIWQYDDDAGEDEAYRQDLLNNHNKEARASQYARTCYDSGDSSAPFSCNMFYNQSIAYKTLTNQRCPFASPDMCLEGLYSAITFDTGLVDATIIGINAPSTHKLRRKTTCSPLNMSEPYVQSVSSSTNETYHYHYGSKKDGTAYTFDTSGRPFQWLAPVYSVK